MVKYYTNEITKDTASGVEFFRDSFPVGVHTAFLHSYNVNIGTIYVCLYFVV